MAGGWIKLSRQIQSHWIWNIPEPYDKRSAWIDLLLLANYEDKKTFCKGSYVECKRGYVNLSIKYLADRWGWSRHKVSDFLDVLEKDMMITQKRTSTRTSICIVNYDVYQVIKDSLSDIKRTSEGLQTDTTKEIKEINKTNISDYRKPVRKNAFNNFKQNDYDFDSLEKELLK